MAMREDEAQTGEMTPARVGPDYPIDLRLTLPLPGRPVFVAIMAGGERRSPTRRAEERRRHPLATAGNALFVALALTGAWALALVGTLIATSILEF